VAAVTEHALLSAWETACGLPAQDRAVTLAAVVGGMPFEDAADLPLGVLGLLLLQLREQCFGPQLDGLTDCPRCGTELDVRIDVGELRMPETGGAASLEVAGQTVRLRGLTSRDIRCAGHDRDRLLARCIVDEVTEPSPNLLDAVEAQLDAMDPQAAPAIDLDCPTCQANWPAPFDIAEFVWTEVERFAHRLLHDVHTLATAYGWSEPDVLAISPARRRFYLQACAP
jgi:hypothetical protein